MPSEAHTLAPPSIQAKKWYPDPDVRRLCQRSATGAEIQQHKRRRSRMTNRRSYTYLRMHRLKHNMCYRPIYRHPSPHPPGVSVLRPMIEAMHSVSVPTFQNAAPKPMGWPIAQRSPIPGCSTSPSSSAPANDANVIHTHARTHVRGRRCPFLCHSLAHAPSPSLLWIHPGSIGENSPTPAMERAMAASSGTPILRPSKTASSRGHVITAKEQMNPDFPAEMVSRLIDCPT